LPFLEPSPAKQEGEKRLQKIDRRGETKALSREEREVSRNAGEKSGVPPRDCNGAEKVLTVTRVRLCEGEAG